MNELLRRLLNLPPQASTVARDLDRLHFFVIGTTLGGALLVSALAGYYLLRYRRQTARGGPRPPDLHKHHTRGGTPFWVEGIIIGGFLTLFCAWWVIGFRQYVRLRIPPENASTVYVTAKKWMWTFASPNGSTSNSILYVPRGQPVKLVMSSRDVIHSFYVPAFRIKQDVLPGRATTTWFEATELGAFPILCAEYCGTGHSTMRGQVVVLTESDYERHLDRRVPRHEVPGPGETLPGLVGRVPPTPLTLADVGELVAVEKGCLRCHTADGSPHIGPTWVGLYASRVELEDNGSALVDEAFITQSMMDPRAHIHRGYPPVMPSYQGLVTAAETGAIVEYIKRLQTIPDAAERAPLAPEKTEVVLPGPRPHTERNSP